MATTRTKKTEPTEEVVPTESKDVEVAAPAAPRDALAALPQDADMVKWSPQQTAIMEQLGLINRANFRGRLPDAPLGFIESFLNQCRRTQLDPLARQIYGAEMGGKWTVLVSIDGFRVIAQRSGEYRGQTQPQWCGPDGVWRDVWLDETTPPAAARIGVYREGFSEPVYAVATYAGYVPRDFKTNAPKPVSQWKTNPSNQLLKVAEMLALRKAFPNDLSGIYGTEEMDQARNRPTSGGAPAASEQPAPQPQAPELKHDEALSEEWVRKVSWAPTKNELRALYEEAKGKGILDLAVPHPAPQPGFPAEIALGAYIIGMAKQAPEVGDDGVVDAEVVPDDEPGDLLAQAQAKINTDER